MARKLVVVDDQTEARQLITLVLSTEDHVIHEVGSGENAIDMVRALEPDTVILDVVLPGPVNGLDICRAIKSDPVLRRTGVILVTARGEPQDMEAGWAAGADAYIVKPFGFDHLVSTVERVAPGGAGPAGSP